MTNPIRTQYGNRGQRTLALRFPIWRDPFTNTAVNPGDVGPLLGEFDAVNQDDRYDFPAYRDPKAHQWPQITPDHAPPIPAIDGVIRKMMEATWKTAEPQAGVQRGNAGPAPLYNQGGPRTTTFIGGARSMGPTGVSAQQQYHPQVRPTNPVLNTQFPNNSAIATDWNLFNWIERTNAVTFRGDTRPPVEVIVNAGGFKPPNTRDDQYYLENNIYAGFSDYMKRRYGQDIGKNEFLHAATKAFTSHTEKQLYVDYMLWRSITEKESAHLGRMVEHELLKAYISTARVLDVSAYFGTGYYTKSGWLYVALIHGGFVVPNNMQGEQFWGTDESEIAQLGPIPPDRIVAFRRLWMGTGVGYPCGPIFIRKTFRATEPNACGTVYDYLSGKLP